MLSAGNGAQALAMFESERPHRVLRRRDVEAGAFDAATEVYPFLPGDRVFLLSDGVLDTRDRQERLFGVERLQAVFAANREPRLLIEDIQQALNSFGGQARDDVSMVEISSLAQPSPAGYKPGLADDGEFSPLHWALTFELRGATLRRFKPLPRMLQLLPGARPAFGAIGQRFHPLHLQVAAVGPGGRLKIRVEDSGAGFDSRAVLARAPVTSGLYGRGLRLVRELSDCSHWSMDGRSACVEFVWGGPPDS